MEIALYVQLGWAALAPRTLERERERVSETASNEDGNRIGVVLCPPSLKKPKLFNRTVKYEAIGILFTLQFLETDQLSSRK